MELDNLLGRLHCDLEEWYEKLSDKDCDRITETILELINKIEDNGSQEEILETRS